MRALLFAAVLGFVALPFAYGGSAPVLTGFITEMETPSSFRVDGTTVLCSPTVTVGTGTGCASLHLGQTVKVYGKRDHHSGSVAATGIVPVAPARHKLEGVAIVDAVAPAGESAEWSFRADGYRMLMTPATARPTSAKAAQHGPADPQTNLWVHYAGTQDARGVLVLTLVEFTPNTVGETERKLRERLEFNPAANTDAHAQGGLSKTLLGVDVTRSPIHEDAAMQARVSALGKRLIPAYQKQLPDTDPTKILFRFQVVDQPRFRDAITMPNGIILVPYQVVEQLQDDAELAALLADNLAYALEKEDFRTLRKAQVFSAMEVAGWAAGSVGPAVAGGSLNSTVQRHAEEQSARVSLSLLADAGFPVGAAALTRWRLDLPPGKPLEAMRPSPRAVYLYQMIDSTWSPPAEEGSSAAAQ